MMKLSMNRTLALAALALAVAFAAATRAQTQPPVGGQQSVNCATARVTLSSANPKAGDVLTATVSVENCSAEKERLVIKYSHTDSCGEMTQLGTAALRLKPGETQPAQINFTAPAATGCEGGFKMSAVVMAAGNELTTVSAPFSTRAQ